MRTRRLQARLAYVMRLGDFARETYAAATPAVGNFPGVRQSPAKIAGNAKALDKLFARRAG
jgi:hypothetical protein